MNGEGRIGEPGFQIASNNGLMNTTFTWVESLSVCARENPPTVEVLQLIIKRKPFASAVVGGPGFYILNAARIDAAT